jgi:hypothetical protein
MLIRVGLVVAVVVLLAVVALAASRPSDPRPLQDRPVQVTNAPDPVPPTPRTLPRPAPTG